MNLSLPNDREFAWKDGTLWCENVPLKDLAARFGTPLYVYSKRAIVTAFQSYQKPLEPYKHLMCFAVKANSNLSIIRLLGELGAGFDIVSEGASNSSRRMRHEQSDFFGCCQNSS